MKIILDDKPTHGDEAATPEAQVLDGLRKRGHRITTQRESILRIFKTLPAGVHLSADELRTKLRETGSKVSSATMYRTLNLLSATGVLRELDFAEGHKHYELKQDRRPHQHLVCVGCNTTIEFSDDSFEEAGKNIAAEFGYEVIDAQFKVSGLCPACRQKRDVD